MRLIVGAGVVPLIVGNLTGFDAASEATFARRRSRVDFFGGFNTTQNAFIRRRNNYAPLLTAHQLQSLLFPSSNVLFNTKLLQRTSVAFEGDRFGARAFSGAARSTIPFPLQQRGAVHLTRQNS